MKTRPQLLFLAGAAVLALGACATVELSKGTAELSKGRVSLHEAYIEIHPGTNISMDDEKQLDRILRKYNSLYYKIKKTENGQVKTPGATNGCFY
jgi:hypothetical protein